MGMFRFFKGRKPVEVEVESVTFDGIGKWLEKKSNSFRKDERDALEKIGVKLLDFYISIEEKLGVLEGIDIEAKKEHERAKILVRQGLDKYVNSVRILLKDLDGLAKNELEDFAKSIVNVFNHFEKTSALFYGRANYLIGDEMAAVRNEIRRFYNGLVEIFKESLIEDLRKVGAVKLKLDEFGVVKKSLEDVEEEIGVNDLGIDKLGKGVEGLRGEVEEICKSSAYISRLKARNEIKSFRIGIDGEIGRLKDIIDFKRLTNIVHSNERELGIVKDYKEHFVSEFSKDGGRRLFDLMSGSNMKSAEIVAQIGLIEKRKVELEKKLGKVGLDYTVGKLEEVGKIEERIENLELKNIKANRRFEELKFKLKGMKNEIVLLVEEFGVDVY